MHLLPPLIAISAFYCRLSFAQQVTAITQAPGFTSLSPCAQNIAVAVIDDSNSPECPGGSPPHCFCRAEAASQEYSDQISTNILNSCLTSPRPEAMQAATVFAAYCSLGDAMTVATTAAGTRAAPTTAASATATSAAAKTYSLTSLPSASYSLSPSSSEADPSTSSAAPGASSPSTSTSEPTSSSNGGGGLDTSDKVALGIGIPSTLAAIVAAYYTYKSYKRKSAKRKQRPQSCAVQ